MVLEAGDAEAGTGLAGALAAKLKDVTKGFKVKEAAPYLNAQAQAIIEYLLANAEVQVDEAPGGTPLAPPGIGVLK